MADHTSLVTAVRALARASRVMERTSEELSFADYRVLSAIEAGEERASRLAHRLAVGKPTISATVDSLHKRGLILRNSVESDARATSLALTEEGRSLVHSMEERMVEKLAVLADRTDDADAVVRALGSLGDAIEQSMQEQATKASA
jgi:DNA-binding MarR family transcriptional regulator